MQGYPVIILRTWGCNLNCSFCDTEFAREGKPEVFSIDRIIEILSSHKLKNILITGGEPLLQADLCDLIERLTFLEYSVSVETNGSLDISSISRAQKRIIDVKCPGSGESGSFLTDNLDRLRDSDEIKFVISSLQDYEYAKSFINSHLSCFRGEVIFSPAIPCLDPKTLAEWVINDNIPVRLQVQLHKILWGNERKR